MKDNWPSLTVEDVDNSISLFLKLFNGGEIKLFGGEPLLEPELVRHAILRAEAEPKIRYVYLSTNGLGLNNEWLSFLSNRKKVILTLSMDGTAKDHRAMRVGMSGVADSYDHVVGLLPRLLKTPRLVVTQTIPPKTAVRAYANFQHLMDLGFRRFNFLPGYFIPWKSFQLDHLANSFADIKSDILENWRRGRYLYVRNIFVRAPTPFFNTGMIVDSDRSIHPCNVGLSSAYDHLREKTKIGDLNAPPSRETLEKATQDASKLLQAAVSPNIWSSTMAADEKLSDFCRDLTPEFMRYKERKRALA